MSQIPYFIGKDSIAVRQVLQKALFYPLLFWHFLWLKYFCCFFWFLFLRQGLSCISQASRELVIFLLQPFMFWDYSCIPHARSWADFLNVCIHPSLLRVLRPSCRCPCTTLPVLFMLWFLQTSWGLWNRQSEGNVLTWNELIWTSDQEPSVMTNTKLCSISMPSLWVLGGLSRELESVVSITTTEAMP